MPPDSVRWSHAAMGSNFNFQVRGEVDRVETLQVETKTLLEEMENSWSRFRPESELSRLNATGEVRGPSTFFKLAIFEASSAYRLTMGSFDPRVKRALAGIGYDRSFTQIGTGAEVPPSVQKQDRGTAPIHARPLSLRYDVDQDSIALSDDEIDLGGIGKGLALRVLSTHLLHSCDQSHLIEAGGDIATYLARNDKSPWFVDVENPLGVSQLPILVRAGSCAIATSSTKIRNWTQAGAPKHHIIDPSTLDSSTSDLVAVTVIDSDSARAEVISKWIFLLGAELGSALAARRRIPALLVRKNGAVEFSPKFARYMEVQGQAATLARRAEHYDQESPLPLVSISA